MKYASGEEPQVGDVFVVRQDESGLGSNARHRVAVRVDDGTYVVEDHGGSWAACLCFLVRRAQRWSCVVPGKPRTKGNSGRVMRFGKLNKMVPSEAAVKAQSDARSVITARAPASPFTGAVIVDVVFVFAVAQGKRKGKNAIAFGSPCLLAVDRGNLLKLIEDAMNGLVYLDDKQVVGGDVSKIWGDVDETRITVRTVDAVEVAA